MSSNTPLVVYTKSNCPNCVNAKNLLDSVGIEYTTIAVDDDPDALNFLRSEGHKSIPQLYKDGSLYVVGGFQGLHKMYKEGNLVK